MAARGRRRPDAPTPAHSVTMPDDAWTPITLPQIAEHVHEAPPAQRWRWQVAAQPRRHWQLAAPDALYDFKATARGLFIRKVTHAPTVS